MAAYQYDFIKIQASEALARCFKNLNHEVEASLLYDLLERPPEKKLGDFALPCFRFAKEWKIKPADIAKALAEELSKIGETILERQEIAGPFLNLFLSKAKLASFLIPNIKNEDYFKLLDIGKNQKVMIEFSQPNTHKEFHIGHLRNVCLGDSICAIYNYTKHNVIPVNYIGDEGTHVAKCLWALKEYKEIPENLSASQWYGKFYVLANESLEKAEGEEKKKILAEISLILGELEQKSGPYYGLWLKTKDECMDDFKKIYSWLNVHFDHYFFESEVTESCQNIVDTFIEKGLFKESDGAYGIDMSEDGLGFFMARKSDGTSLYVTKDLALAQKKFEDFKIEKSIYIVGSEQNFHFKQLFKALEKMGFPQAKDSFHLSYALVSLPDGKISSRKGNAYPFSKLVEMLNEELDKYLDKYKTVWTDEEILAARKKLCSAAIKYGMLHADPQKEIVFDLKSWTSFEGNSGPYLLYSFSRSQSILRECQKRSYQEDQKFLYLLENEYESELLNKLSDFNEAIFTACIHYKPSSIAQYLFGLCKVFNRFYANSSVLNAENANIRSARLCLISAFGSVLQRGLKLLGIETLEKM